MNSNRIAVFGGSFNPPHFSHVSIITWIFSTNNADQVWMIPCWDHMFGKKMLPFHHRMVMCQEVSKMFTNCYVSDVEKRLGGKSLTLNTIVALKKEYPNYDFSLIMGIDNWNIRDKWEGFELLEKECNILVPGNMCFDFPSIRSTDIREKIKTGKDVSSVVPYGALKYINENNLYKGD